MNDDSSQDYDKHAAATASFPFDRMAVQRFREAFPRARWSDTLRAWIVPGTSARRRIDRWMAAEAARHDVFANQKGRDAYEFEPIISPYLEVTDHGFRIRTPFSRTIVDALRRVPFASWHGDDRVWDVPYASYDELQSRWQIIEEAAKRAEPEERRKRAEERRGTPEEAMSRRRSAERRKHRLPVLSDDLPPLGRPLATPAYGIVVVTEITGELVELTVVKEFYPAVNDKHVWAGWRSPTLGELVQAWPARKRAGEYERCRGWWSPTLEELRVARRKAKAHERAKVTKRPADCEPHD
ncbi:hypothetical protein [Rhizobium sp. BK251]|uniref:hypothetical protein n=1 Tax=Rhizobium sp. BK251 TaxID=2512125 RepID=UPI00104A24DC|nr:hypothetical protein [Rhizobium sp. BK251]TCL66305.1 hypothetical protein EV286_11116 [Rhizobium sp. BK251]